MSAIAFSRPKAQRNVSVGRRVLHTPIRVCPDQGTAHVNRSGRVGLNNKTGLEDPIGGDKPARHHTFLRRPRPFTSEAKDTARHVPLSIGSALGCWREPDYILTTRQWWRIAKAAVFVVGWGYNVSNHRRWLRQPAIATLLSLGGASIHPCMALHSAVIPI